MKKFIAVAALFAMIFTGASAQFEAGTKYIGASLSGLSLQYSSNERMRFNLDGAAGLFVSDGLLVYANFGYGHTRYTDDISAGLNGRYYFTQNGIFLGAGAQFVHYTKSNNDLMVPVEIGYAFYLNHYLTVEPSVYYKMSMHDFSDNSSVGLKIGLGYYF